MNADTKQDYTIDEVALWKADINPSLCHRSVRCAANQQLPGYERAVSYLEQIEKQIELGILKPSQVLPPPASGGGIVFIGLDEFYLSAEDAMNWQPGEDNPFKSSQSKSDSDKSAPISIQLMLAMVIDDWGYYEKYDKQGRKGGQIAIINRFQELAEKYKTQGKLSKTTLQRNIKTVKDTLREYGHIEDN